MLKKKYHQIFISGEDKYLYIYVYLKKFNRKAADKVFNSYIKKYSNKNFDELQLTFLDTQFAEGYLELINKKNTDKKFYIPMTGTKILKGIYNYKLTDKKLNDIVIYQ
ncbi:MAG: hypothetical protein EHM58_13325 [Ignavibacteriae bacterium]|nr:MAG: hypothetical protein EHM58_13325 [Ignavibacteriota bacterium]